MIVLSPFFIPHPSERNAINIVQFSDKSTEDFPVICYTDGSKIDGRVGFAFVVFRSGVEYENFQFRIRDECTVFVAELLCLNFAVKWITEQNSVISEYLICTDSLSSLDYLKCISSSNNIIVEIQKQLKSLRDKNISIDFAFVRGHTDVLGNERVDWLAKAATKRKIDIDVNIPKSFYKKITKERMEKFWNQEYLISNKGSITKKFFPTINKRLSCHHFCTNYELTQFLTGHSNFKSYLNKFNLVPSSFCGCNIGGEENVEHRINIPQHQTSARANGAPVVNNSIYGSSQSRAADPFQHIGPSLCVSSILCPPYQSLNSPAKHVVPVVAAQAAQPPALQIPQSLLTQVGAQQYVPVSVVEQNGRQMLFTNTLQPEWPGNRQMFVPSWQPRPFQQPVIPETETWGRPLVLERATLLPEQPSLIPVEVHDTAVYNHLRESNQLNSLLPPQGTGSTANLSQPWTIMPAPAPFAAAATASNQQHRHIQQASSHRALSKSSSTHTTPTKRPAKAIYFQHHNNFGSIFHEQEAKFNCLFTESCHIVGEKGVQNSDNENLLWAHKSFLDNAIESREREPEHHYSPARKRLKESNSVRFHVPMSTLSGYISNPVVQAKPLPNQTVHWTSHNSKNLLKNGSRISNVCDRDVVPEPPIIICDTPSPAVSVITISSDSEDEVDPVVITPEKKSAKVAANQNIINVATTCDSVIPLTPDNHGYCNVKYYPEHHANTQLNSNFKGQPKSNQVCVTVFDSDSDDQNSPVKNHLAVTTKVIKPEPQKENSKASVCQKKRILSHANLYHQNCQLSNGSVVHTKQEIITEDDLNISHSSLASTQSQASSVSVTIPTLLSGRYSGNYSKHNDLCLMTHFCGREQKSSIIIENGDQISNSDDLVRQLPTTLQGSPVSHISQPLYLTTSQADIYRDFCRSTVSSNLSQPTYISTQSEKYILTAAEHSASNSFAAAQLPVPPPAHHHTSRTTITSSIPYSGTSSHPLPAHMQPATVGASSTLVPTSALPLVSFPTTLPQAPGSALCAYTMNGGSPTKPQFHIYC
ncbi:homeodomain-interacting protein kinase 2 [Trichonephila clavipes]|nr:homeodomain-interacting protein kinase 2 [Trichonephila clavipes]